jgi:hypothetical protein
MLQTIETIGYYQKVTDALVEMWHRGYRFDDYVVQMFWSLIRLIDLRRK